jgi:antitoxin component of MazEF toxin-antitoxin module
VACLTDQPSILLEELDIFKGDKFTVFADGDTIVASITEAGVLDTEPAEMPDEVPTIMEELAAKSEE